MSLIWAIHWELLKQQLPPSVDHGLDAGLAHTKPSIYAKAEALKSFMSGN